jgi:hypothetical protein
MLRESLEIIAQWRLPESGKFWPSGEPMSYTSAYGSNGARDYIRSVARNALPHLYEYERAPSTPRRQGAVELLIAMGFVWKDGRWMRP